MGEILFFILSKAVQRGKENYKGGNLAMTGTSLNLSEIFGGVDRTVYHYTSPSTFEKIISNRELWFSRCDCLNDYEDGELVRRFYHDCLNELQENREISREYCESVIDIGLTHFAFRTEKTVPLPSATPGSLRAVQLFGSTIECRPFVCCFSQCDDSLQMWQYYSKVGSYEGYNIGFSLKQMLQIENYLSAGKIIYEEEQQKKTIKKVILHNYKDYCANLIENGGIITDKEQYLKSRVVDLNSDLTKLSCFFKRDCFKGEKEVRLVLEVPTASEHRDKLWMKQSDAEYPVPIKYTFTHAMMVPHVVVSFNPDSVKSVMIGPITSAIDNSIKKNKEIVEEFLFDRLGRRIPVSTSGIPVRR